MRRGRPAFVRHGSGTEGRTESTSISIAASGSVMSMDADAEGGVGVGVSEVREEPAMSLVVDVDERATWGLNSASSKQTP